MKAARALASSVRKILGTREEDTLEVRSSATAIGVLIVTSWVSLEREAARIAGEELPLLEQSSRGRLGRYGIIDEAYRKLKAGAFGIEDRPHLKNEA